MNAYEIREPGYGSGGRSDRAGPDRPLPAGGGGAAGDRSERRVDCTAVRARHGRDRPHAHPGPSWCCGVSGRAPLKERTDRGQKG